MKWNSLKFQMLRLGKNQELKDSTYFFTPEYSDIIEHKEVIKDLGVMVDDKLSYNDQTMKAINKARQKLGWILRAFRTRSVMFLRTLWNSFVQPH